MNGYVLYVTSEQNLTQKTSVPDDAVMYLQVRSFHARWTEESSWETTSALSLASGATVLRKGYVGQF